MKENKKSKYIIILLIAVIVVLIATGSVLGFMLYKSNQQTNSSSEGIVFDNNASHYEKNTLQSSENSTGIKVPGYPDITISSESDNIPITLLNPKDNPCNFKFTLVLEETGEELASTGLVKPGDAVNGVDLQEMIPKGEYTLLINISTYDLKTGASMNGAQVKTNLTSE